MANKYCLNDSDHEELLFALIKHQDIVDANLKMHYEDAGYWQSEIIISMFHIAQMIANYEKHLEVPNDFIQNLILIKEMRCSILDEIGERFIDYLFEKQNTSFLCQYHEQLSFAKSANNNTRISELKDLLEKATSEEILYVLDKIYIQNEG